MSDNLFDRLFELFQTSDTVNWRLAEEIIKSVAGDREPIHPQLAEEYEELALAAHLRIAGSGAFEDRGGTVPHPIDRAGWATENHRAFGYLVEPLAEAMSTGMGGGTDPMASLMGPLGPALIGMQAGTMVGFMSHAVMGQFDAPLPTLDQPAAYLVVPNVEAFATENGFDVRQVRLWATMHELVHHGIVQRPNLRDHISAQIRDLLTGFDFDASRLMETLSRVQDPASIEGLLDESGGLAALLGGREPPEGGFGIESTAAFIEGYGDYIVRIVAGEVLPDLGAIEVAHNERRSRQDEATGQLGQLTGLALDRSHAAGAAELCEEIARRWGDDALDRLWDNPGNLPTLAEFSDAVGWAARVLLE